MQIEGIPVSASCTGYCHLLTVLWQLLLLSARCNKLGPSSDMLDCTDGRAPQLLQPSASLALHRRHKRCTAVPPRVYPKP